MTIQYFATWYILFFIFGIIGLPITNWLCKDWIDRGYGFAKFVGMFAVSMPLWFLSSLHIIPFTPLACVLYVLVALTVAGLLIYKQEIKITRFMVISEVLFFANMLVWTLIRGMNPRAEGTEKFMNLAFMNSINRTEFFPAADPWYVGGDINYYHLGHYMYVFASKVIAIPISYVYNFSLVTIIAQTFVGIFTIIINFSAKANDWVKSVLGIFGGLWLCYGANLHYAFYWLSAKLQGEEFKYFFPDPTRIITNAIDEFPAYSIVLGDVHSHYLALPFLVICIGLVYAAWKIKLEDPRKYIFNAVVSLLVVALYGINSWDFITVSFLFLTLHLYQAYVSKEALEAKLMRLVLAQAAMIIPGVILMLPFLFSFDPPVGGIGIVPLFVAEQIKAGVFTDVNNYFSYIIREVNPWLLFWGVFLIISLLYAGFKLPNYFTEGRYFQKSDDNKFFYLLLFCAFCLIIGVEVFFLKDIFHSSNAPYFRTNTIFKFYYHAWVIFGIVCMWFVYNLIVLLKEKYRMALLPVILVLLLIFWASFSYIFKAVKDFYPKVDTRLVTMDGIDFIAKNEPGDYKAIQWIDENIDGQPVIVEAVGDAYTYYARFSATTGLQTVMGWPTHEWQWRNDSKIPFERKTEVEQFYQGGSLENMKSFIDKYDVTYIVVGSKEYLSYANIREDLISQLAEVVYEDTENKTRIYKVAD